VTIRNRDGSIAYANRAALASMGFSNLEEMLSRSSRAIMDDYLVADEHGEPLSIEDVPSVRMMRGEQADALVMRTVHRKTGEVSWRRLKATPINDSQGELIAAVTVIEDLTALKNAEVRMAILAESGRILASSLDYERTLSNVAWLAVPTLADWCAVDLIDEDMHREHVVAAHQDPAKVAIAERVRELEPADVDPEQVTGRVLRTGTSELYADITDEQLEQGARSEEHLELLRKLEMRSALVVPMRVAARAIGVMTLVSAESRRRFTPEDVEIAEQLGRRAAVAVENARLHTRLSEVAQTLQRSLLPDELPEVPGWRVAAWYEPAGGDQRIDVGGDFYEVFSSGDQWFVVIGDVTGKGVGAATLTALLRHGSRFASRYESHPSGILRQLDDALRGRGGDALCTALCLRLEREGLVVSSAGHPPALVVRRDGHVREIPRSGPLLGAFADCDWPEKTVRLREDETVLLYTDGVTETHGKRDRFGLKRLKSLLSQHARCEPAELLDQLNAALVAFRAAGHDDDIAALALRRES
jgi:PAS domain S-box-containing protein